MDIIKCNDCFRSIHRYAEDHGKCPFCRADISSDDKTDKSFGELPPFLSDKLAKIDEHIEGKRSKEALPLIDEILEWIPGWEIGKTIPRTGEIYWRKLLAETKCKSDFELLGHKGKLLRNFMAFINAKEYANTDEMPVYVLIEKTENLIGEYLTDALNNHETDAKCKTGIENKWPEYKQRMSALEKIAQENIADLEKVEKSLREQAIDCEIVFTEPLYAIGALITEAEEIRKNCDARIAQNETVNLEAQSLKPLNFTDIKQWAIEMLDKLKLMNNGNIPENGGGTKKTNSKSVFGISEEESHKWETQLSKILAESNAALDSLKEFASRRPEIAHWRFSEYLLSLVDQQSIINEINRSHGELETLRSQAEALVSKITEISGKYTVAREAVADGNYAPALDLLDRVIFNDIIRQAMSDTKVDSL